MASRLHWSAGDDKHGEKSHGRGPAAKLHENSFQCTGRGEPGERRALSVGDGLRRVVSSERRTTERDRRVHAPGRSRDSPPSREGAAVFLHPLGRSVDGGGRRNHAAGRGKRHSRAAGKTPSDPQSIVRPGTVPRDLAPQKPRRPVQRMKSSENAVIIWG